MRIWLDADGAPGALREILFRACQRLGVPLTLVANRPQVTPRGPLFRVVVVAQGLDVADDYIVSHVAPGDLVISSDIPLAAQAVEQGAQVITPRGELLDARNVRERLAIRDLREAVQATGALISGPPPYDQKARQAFANALDRWLTAAGRTSRS